MKITKNNFELELDSKSQRCYKHYTSSLNFRVQSCSMAIDNLF